VNAAGWTIAVIAIAIVVVIALRWEGVGRRRDGA